MTKNFYLRQTQPAAAGYSLDAWCDASLLNDYDAGDEIERTLLPEANYEFPDGKTLDLSPATQRSELKRIKFSASGLAAGEYVLPLTVAAQDAPDADKTLYDVAYGTVPRHGRAACHFLPHDVVLRQQRLKIVRIDIEHEEQVVAVVQGVFVGVGLANRYVSVSKAEARGSGSATSPMLKSKTSQRRSRPAAAS